MKLTSKAVNRGVAACALLCVAATFAQAGTIIKLNLGGVGPDVGMGALAGLPPFSLSTVDQTAPGPGSQSGDQLTDIEYTGFLNFIPNINTNTASFSLNGLTAAGPANVFGTLVIQNFAAGVFNLFDPANHVLLSGPIGNSTLTGVIGPPGTGALFTTTLTGVFGGSLAPFIAPGSVSLSMNMTNVNGGNGFGVASGGKLDSFLADAAISISANPVPEPASFLLLGLGSALAMAYGRRCTR